MVTWAAAPNSALVRSRHTVGWQYRCQAVRSVHYTQTPVISLHPQKNEREYEENKLLSYCIALVRLPNKMKVLMWHHLQKIQWQMHPTRGCHCPAKRQVIHLTGKERQKQQIFQ